MRRKLAIPEKKKKRIKKTEPLLLFQQDYVSMSVPYKKKSEAETLLKKRTFNTNGFETYFQKHTVVSK